MAELLICFLLLSVLAYGLFQGVNIYEAFTEGAAQGLKQALGLIPYLLAIMVPIQLWQSAGLTEALTGLLEPLLKPLGMPGEVLPLILLRPLSGSASLGVLTDIYQNLGPDSLAGLLGSIYQGGTDTTFFVISLYYGAVKVSDSRHTLKSCLTADAAVAIVGVLGLKLRL